MLDFAASPARPGRFQLFVLCPGCGQNSAGRTFVPVADFKVTDLSGRYGRLTVPWVLMASGLMAALLLGTAVWEGRREKEPDCRVKVS